MKSNLGGPWNIIGGNLADLKKTDAVMVDRLYAEKKLGVSTIGQVIEINQRRARVVDFTKGIRIFTSQPAVFASFKNAQNFLNLPEDPETLYIGRYFS